MNRASLKNWQIALIIFFIGLVFFLVFQHNRNFIRIESRNAQFIKEMLSHGPSLFPRLYGRPYPDYTSSHTFMMYISSLIGGLNPFSAVLPGALFAALTLVYTYLIGTFHSRNLGIYAVLVLAATEAFFTESRSLTPDIMVMCATTACFYYVCIGEWRKKRKYYWVIPLWLTFAFIIRGPIGLVIPTGVLAAFFLIRKNWLMLILSMIMSGALLVLLLCALVFAAYAEGGNNLMASTLDAQIFGRIESSKSVIHYFIYAFRNYSIGYPLAIITIIFYFKRIFDRKEQDREIQLIRLLAGWALIVIIGMSIPGTKHMRYILPMAPALALLGAFIFVHNQRNAWLDGIRTLIVILCLVVPFGCIVGTIVICLVFSSAMSATLVKILPLIILLLPLTVALILACKFKKLSRDTINFSAMGVMVFSFATFIILVFQPFEQYKYDTSKFSKVVENIRAGKRELVFYQVGPDGEDVQYITNLNKLEIPLFVIFIQEPSPENQRSWREKFRRMLNAEPHPPVPEERILPLPELKNIPASAVILTKEKLFRRMKDDEKKLLRKLSEGRIGKTEFVALEKISGTK